MSALRAWTISPVEFLIAIKPVVSRSLQIKQPTFRNSTPGSALAFSMESRQKMLDFQNYLTYTYKTHMIQGGFQLQCESNYDLSASPFNGTYMFSSLDQYRRVLAGRHVNPDDPDSPLALPTQFTINRGDPVLRYGQHEASWFIQDDGRMRSDADGPQSVPADNCNLRSAWGPIFTDRRHFLFIGGNVTLPYGFRLTPFVNASSGLLFNITTGFDDNHDTVINDGPPGVNRNSDLPASLYPLLPDYCIANCAPGQMPLLLRDYLAVHYPNGVNAVGPGSFNVNLSVNKTFGLGHCSSQSARSVPGGLSGGLDQPLPPGVGGPPGGGRPGGFSGGGPGGPPSGEGSESSRFTVTISAQIMNLFNHVNLGQYSGVLSSPFFGRSNSAGAARQFEFNLRLGF